MKSFNMEIITPVQTHAPREIVFLDVPSERGRLTVLANHEPFICSLTGGKVRIKTQQEEENWSVSTGTMTVAPEMVTLLVREAEEENG